MKKSITVFAFAAMVSANLMAGNLILSEMPPGLHQGNFSVKASYSIDMFPGSSDSYLNEGPVDNVSGYDLQSSLRTMNSVINDKINSLNLFIRLSCKNNATISYQFGDEIVNADQDIVLTPPDHCG